MKYILPLILILASLTPAQNLPSDDPFIRNFRQFDKSRNSVFFINDVNVTRKGNITEFYAFLYEDEHNYALTLFYADCLSFRWVAAETKGRFNGKLMKIVSTKSHASPPGTPIAKALTIVCGAIL